MKVDKVEPSTQLLSKRPRRQTKKVFATVPDTDDGSESDFSDKNDYSSPPPPKKRARTNAPKVTKGDSSVKPKGKRRGNAGKLADLMQMPIDIFIEICLHLMPLDLLRLARTSKFLRSLLMSQSARVTWKHAISCVEGIPACPIDLSEPAYASLVFDTACKGCGNTKFQKVDFHTRLRVCKACAPEFLVTRSDLHYAASTIVDELFPLLCSSNGNNYNRVDAMETLETFQALKKDPDAFEKFKAQRKQRVEQIRGNARALTEWKDGRTVANSAKNRNATWRRKTAIIAKLVELGWDKERDVDAINNKEFSKMLNQPRDLTPLIWKRVRPPLEVILGEHKEQRLTAEKLQRHGERKRLISTLTRTLAEESQKRGDNGTMGAAQWTLTFPTAYDALYTLPSIIPLVENDDEFFTEETFRAHEKAILRDINILQMKVRRVLVAKIRTEKAKHGLDAVDVPPPVLEDIDAVDVDVLKADDQQNISILSDPTTFFCIYPESHGRKGGNYPEILYGVSYSDSVVKYYPAVVVDLERCSMAKAIINASPTISALEQSVVNFENYKEDKIFICLCCPKGLRERFSWNMLVGHFVSHKVWYEQEAAKKKLETSALDPPFLDDHITAKAALIDLEQYNKLLHCITAAAERDRSMGSWACKHCTRRPPSAYCGSQKLSSKKGSLILHLKSKHGIAKKDAHEHMEDTGLRYRHHLSIVEEKDKVGCKCEDCIAFNDDEDNE